MSRTSFAEEQLMQGDVRGADAGSADPPVTVWLPQPGDRGPAVERSAGLAPWAVARLVSRFAVPCSAVVRIDDQGRRTTVCAGAGEPAPGHHAGLVIVELGREQAVADRVGTTRRLLSDSGCLAVVLPGRSCDHDVDALDAAAAGQVVAGARAVGLVYLQHIVVVDAVVADDSIEIPEALGPVGEGVVHVRVHRDVLVFTTPGLHGHSNTMEARHG